VYAPYCMVLVTLLNIFILFSTINTMRPYYPRALLASRYHQYRQTILKSRKHRSTSVDAMLSAEFNSQKIMIL
jgi:hypothetical protein